MSDMSDVRIYKKNDIEKFIKKLENKKDYDFKRVFEKAGAFLGENYIIYSTSNSFYEEVCPLKALQKFIKNKFDEYFDDDIRVANTLFFIFEKVKFCKKSVKLLRYNHYRNN